MTKWTVQEANNKTGGLSKPSKMPGYGWGIPAGKADWVAPSLRAIHGLKYGCNVGAKLQQVKGSVCAKCYATRNMYTFPNARKAQANRIYCYHVYKPWWADAMAYLINRYADKHPYFRWFDSGDLIDSEMLDRINAVCLMTLSVQHYLPTKEYKLIRNYKDHIMSNLRIRVSSPMIDQAPLSMVGYPSVVGTSTVYSKDNTPMDHCPAQSQGNNCGECRVCWDSSISNVAYPSH